MRPAVITECPDQTLLFNFLNEQLTVAQLSALDAHVSTCPQCKRRLEELVESRWGSGTISMLAGPIDDRPPPRFADYETLQQIAVGGMGVVWRVRDAALGRDLAVKIIKPALADRRTFRARFLREARLCARLAHPNIVPVHSQGELADGRPYYTMKLVEGETLAQLLRHRAAEDDASSLLPIFAQVCQAVAFAHRQGVIHRDLKPLNIMVGAHGEVQLMDWGLAKDLKAGDDLRTEPGDAGDASDSTATSCVRTSSETTAGDIIGTLAYMPPEQARGEEQLTFAADVFSLGAILCEILTGQPVYHGENLNEVLRCAVAADLSDAQQRLNNCSGDPNLIEITRNCLAVDAAQRPRDAAALAAQLAAFQTGIQRRLEEERLAAEHQRGAALAREQSLRREAQWERRRRRLTTCLSASVVAAMLLVGGLAMFWINHRRESLQAREAADEGIANVAAAMRDDDLPLAEVELRRAQALLNDQPEYRAEDVQQLGDALALARRLEAVRHEYFTWSNAWFDCCTALDRYALEFEQAGWSVPSDAPEATSQRVASSPVKHRLLAALDDWAWLAHREAMRTDDKDERRTHLQLRDRLLAIAREADPNSPATKLLRDGAAWEDVAKLREAVDGIDPQKQSPELLVLLGKLLPTADRQVYFRRCQHFHADDFWMNAELGRALLDDATGQLSGELPVDCPPMMQAVLHDGEASSPAQELAAQAVGYYRAALAQHPQVLGLRLDLATALALSGDVDAAAEVCEAAIATAAADLPAHELAEAQLQLGLLRLRSAKVGPAMDALKAAIELDDYYTAATEHLVYYLLTTGRPGDARQLAGELGLPVLPDGQALEILADFEGSS